MEDVAVLQRLWLRIKALWHRAKTERATPREIGWAVFLGGFLGCTPALGFRGWLSIGAATLLRQNRLFAWLTSQVLANMIVTPPIVVAEVQIAHRLRTGAWVAIDRDHALEQAGALLLDWCLGTIPVGIAVGGALGLLAFALARARDRRRATAAEA